MRKAGLAEWVLKRAAGAERGTAMYGDLVELAATRGTGWFRLEYTRTVLALRWRTAAAFVAGIACFDLLDRLTRGDAGFTLWVAYMVSPVIANIAAAFLLIIPYGAVRYGLRDRMVQLSCVTFALSAVAGRFLPPSFVFAILAAISIVAFSSNAWRGAATVLVGGVAVGAALSACFDGALGWHIATAVTLAVMMLVCSGLRNRLLVSTDGRANACA